MLRKIPLAWSSSIMLIGCLSTLGNLVIDEPARAQPIAFEDSSTEIPFTHRSWEFGGDGLTGAAWFDFDRDGDQDLFMSNGQTQPAALFRNNGDGTFDNITAAAGLSNNDGVSTPLAVDLDNDGYQELFLSGEGGIFHQPIAEPPSLKLYYNNGDGTFTDITSTSGLVGPETQMSAAFGDIDNDRDLDLFITTPGTLGPPVTSHRSRLFLNNGDLTFTDISASAGIDTALGSCVVLFSDHDEDGLIDIFVGNCTGIIGAAPIELFHNNGDLTFTDVAQQAGIDIPGFWMSLSPGDIDNDGDVDLFLTNDGPKPRGPLGDLGDRPHALLRNNGDGTYTDIGVAAGFGDLEFGWGAVMSDFDNDGWVDVFFAGSLPDRFVGGFLGPDGLANRGRLLFNNKDNTFTDHSDSLPYDFSSDYTSGVAAADYDNDGFEDVVVVLTDFPGLTSSAQPVLLHNLGGTDHSWIKVQAVGTVSNRDGVGARFILHAGELVQAREVYAGSSFASMNSQVVSFGLGSHDAADLDVRWPSGYHNRLYDVPAGAEVVFPELPCSFDDPQLSFVEFKQCMLEALADLVVEDVLRPQEAAWFLRSGIRAYHLETKGSRP